MSELGPFLSPADTRRPPSLPESSLDEAPPARPDRLTDRSPVLAAPHADPNDLGRQRWGVVAPAGAAGDALVGGLEALVRQRGGLQDATPRVFRIERAPTAPEARRWVREVYLDEAIPTEERPRYLILLGDLDTSVNEHLQLALQHEAYVGRLPFAEPAKVEAYAARVVAAEWRPGTPAVARRAVFCADGTPATDDARFGLADTLRGAGVEVADTLRGEAARDAVLAGVREAAVLLSVTHGLGRPEHGDWRDAGEQRARQGALDFGGGAVLGRDELPEGAFLPGGFWFLFACFGAGTPGQSAYHRWLVELESTSRRPRDAAYVLRSLPRPEEAPFTAALPAEVLSREDGPLGVAGHLDLAWSYGYREVDQATRARRFADLLGAVAEGARLGVAMDGLHHAFRQQNDRLAAAYEDGGDDPRARAARARLWMARNDLRGYVLLGDPAAAVVRRGPALQGAVEDREGAVLRVLRGEAVEAVAAAIGAEPGRVTRWVEAYRAAGRAALAAGGR